MDGPPIDDPAAGDMAKDEPDDSGTMG